MVSRAIETAKSVRHRIDRLRQERVSVTPMTPGVFMAEVRALCLGPQFDHFSSSGDTGRLVQTGGIRLDDMPVALRNVFVDSLSPRKGTTFAGKDEVNTYQLNLSYSSTPRESEPPAHVVLTRLAEGKPVSRIGVKFGKDETTGRPELTVGHVVVDEKGVEKTVKQIVVGQYEGRGYIQEVHTPGIKESRHDSFAPHAPAIAGELVAFAKIQGSK